MVFKKVALYLRKSREDESLEETLARHERMLVDYCKRNNLLIVDIFREVVSGESLEARPEALEMLDNVDCGMYDGVVVVELERLSRGNQIDQVEIAETFKRSGTKIYTLNKVYDLSNGNDFDEEFFEFGLFMSRREYKIIKRRLLRGRLQSQKEGYFIGSTLPYGFSKVRDIRGFVLTPNEETQFVELIFHKFVNEGYSISDIRKYLDTNGIKPLKDDFWSNLAVKRILSNKLYLGYIRQNTRGKTVYIKGKHSAVIDEHLFDMAQEKLAIKSVKLKKSADLTNPLASLVKCSMCGSTMQKATTKIRCYKDGCKNVLSYFDVVEKKLIEELQAELADFNYFLDNYEEELTNQRKTALAEINIVKKQLAKKEKMINRACEMLEEGIYSKAKFLERTAVLEKEKELLQASLFTLENSSISNQDVRAKKAIPILEKVLKRYWDLSPADKNALLKTIIDRVEYTKTKHNTRWNKQLDDLELKIYLKI
jgi:DNA invertase Pin-like site-specific DNA recombinase